MPVYKDLLLLLQSSVGYDSGGDENRFACITGVIFLSCKQRIIAEN